MHPPLASLYRVTLTLALSTSLLALHPKADAGTLSITQLETRLATIDTQLLELADITMRSGVGAIGYRSSDQKPNTNEWVQIELDEPTQIDQVVLVPSIARIAPSQVIADAFPLEFKIIVGESTDSIGETVAHLTADDKLLPRVAPVVVSFPPQEAKWLRIEALTLTPRLWDNFDLFELSELMIFSGDENVALHQKVTASSSDDGNTDAYNKRFLVDGFVPYLMTSNQGEKSIAFMSEADPGPTPIITIDLGKTQKLDQINLHSIEVSNKVPQSIPNNFATPGGIIVEGALESDFTNSILLAEFHMHSPYENGPYISQRFPESECRYVRLIVPEQLKREQHIRSRGKIGFAEIELLLNGKNVSSRSASSSNFELDSDTRSHEALTDGRNFYGNILPLRDWMEQLALRHELETERPLLEAELKRRYARQKQNYNRLLLLVVSLLAGTIIIILILKNSQQRVIQRIRQHIAADLHDELGANLHALGLLSDLTRKSKNAPDKLDKLLKRIRSLTEQTGESARYCSDMLDAKELYEGIPDQMRRASSHILQGFEHELKFEGENELHRLSPRKRIDLCLFHKECLTNILRHSGATRITTQLIATPKSIRLIVTDNGQGLSKNPGNNIPQSISRRSNLLHSKLQVQSPPTGGTCITLTISLRRFYVI